MKRLLTILLAVLMAMPVLAVKKERDLARTLGVLRLELERSYNSQKVFMARYEALSTEQHEQLVEYMKRSEQISLILYSQRTDFTLDMAYACQQATDLYRALNTTNIPYKRMLSRMSSEVARYDSLITSLMQLPPAIGGEESVSEQLDSLIAEVSVESDTIDVGEDPFLLSPEEQEDRDKCLLYAKALRNNLVRMMNSMNKDNRYYQQVSDRVGRQHDYAQQCYADMQNSIYKNGDNTFFVILAHLPGYLEMIKRDFTDKYVPFGDGSYSEWRGTVMLGVSVFMLFYMFVATLLSMLLIRGVPRLLYWLSPGAIGKVKNKLSKRILNAEEYKYKKNVITLALGIALFAIAIMLVRQFMYHNLLIMAADLMVNFAWLMEAILLSLLIRLKGKQLTNGLNLYLPFVTLAFVVILFRIVLIPNSLVNLIYPIISLICLVWQVTRQSRFKEKLPLMDNLYATISLAVMVGSCICSWMGFTLLAVQVVIWWTFQLTAMQTIICLYDITRMYEERILIKKLAVIDTFADTSAEELSQSMRKGDMFTRTWLFDFVRITLIPVFGVLSVLFCIRWAAGIFEMTSIVEEIFFYNFLDQQDVVQVSLFKLCIVAAFFFVFKYINYAVRSYYRHWYHKAKKDDGNFNETLTRNVIAILVWGVYAWFTLILLQVPKSGISVVTAGLATGLGFAMKDLLENFFYGISLMTGRVRVGDYIECDGVQGKVESITYQSTQITTLDGSVIAFLNSSLFSQNFKNLTRNHEYVMAKIPVGVAYGTNVEQVRNLLVPAIEKLRTVLPDGRHLINPEKEVKVVFSDFGDNSVDLVAVAWVLVDQRPLFLSQVREVIYDMLNEHNIEIPFPQRDIYIRKISGFDMQAANNGQEG